MGEQQSGTTRLRMTAPNISPESASREQHNLRRLQFMMQLLVATILQDPSITVEDAAQMAADTRTAALRMFPGSESTYNLLCHPRIQRAMQERFHMQ